MVCLICGIVKRDYFIHVISNEIEEFPLKVEQQDRFTSHPAILSTFGVWSFGLICGFFLVLSGR